VQEDLAEKLREHYGPEPTPIMQKHLDFGLSSRARGAKMLDRVHAETGVKLRGKRVLDVGSAYGGFVIEAASRGAEAWGIEINRRYHDWGCVAARGEPGEIHQVHADFLSREALAVLPRDFDLVVVNDVFEHVHDTAALLKQLYVLMRPGAAFVFSIPNGDAVSAVEREGHYGTPGITQLPPNRWHKIVPHFTAYYRPWSYYSGLFRSFGFGRVEPWRGRPRLPGAVRSDIESGLARAAAAIAALEVERQMRKLIDAGFDEYRARVAEDLARGDTEVLAWRYLTTFWKGCAYKEGRPTADLNERPPRRRLKEAVSPRRLARGLRYVAMFARGRR
jgi:SAM-dependent methyltransferase